MNYRTELRLDAFQFKSALHPKPRMYIRGYEERKQLDDRHGFFFAYSSTGDFIADRSLFLVLLGRVAYLQTYGREATISRADRQQHLILTLQARRGDIYDRNGLMMAGSIQTHSLFVDPKFMQDSYQEDGHSLVEMDEALDRLAGIIGKDPFELAKLLGDRATSRFVKVAEDLDDSTVQQIDALNLPGVGIDSSSAVLSDGIAGGLRAGGMRSRWEGSGRSGIEIQRFVVGPAGVCARDEGRAAASDRGGGGGLSSAAAWAPFGADDRRQSANDRRGRVRDAVDRVHAPRGEFVVMDPYTGDVLALANYPTFNPQTLSDSTPDMRRDSALVAPYEPGSTFKPYLVGPALMWGVTTESEVWPIPGRTWFTPYGRAITDVEHYGNLCTWDGLVKSSNILMSQLSERMGNARLRRAMTSFGFGRRTGIDLPGENAGVVYPLSKWTRKSTESVRKGTSFW